MAGRIDVFGHATSESTDDRAIDFAGDFLDGGEVAFAGDRETGFDDIDAESRKLAGDFELLTRRHGGPGTLLTVTERGVKDDDSVVFHVSFFVVAARLSFISLENKNPTAGFGSGVCWFNVSSTPDCRAT
jgi:hypothetical protein